MDQEFSGEGASSRTNRIRLLVVGTVVVLALGYMIYAAFPANALYFLTVSEFMERAEVQDGQTVRVSGRLVEDSFQRQGNSTFSSFRLTDKEAPTGNEALTGNEAGAEAAQLRASYEGVLPDLFFNPHSEIILQGSYGADQVFQTQEILVKCPSKYQSLEEEYPADEYPREEYPEKEFPGKEFPEEEYPYQDKEVEGAAQRP